MTASIRLVAVASLLVAAAACSSDDDSGDGADGEAPTATESAPDEATETETETGTETDTEGETETETETETDDGADDSTEADSDVPSGSGGGTATLTLENGEVFEFAQVLCSLEPQMAAGSEILFTATSYEDPGLDITQFGDEGTITGVASISVYDNEYQTLWSADSMMGSDVELTLDGSTIRGTASFFQGEDFAGETVTGDVVANC